MIPEKSGNNCLAYFAGSLNLRGLTMTKVILWLIAITLVSFVIGIIILAVSGNLPDRHGKSASPFVEGGSLENTTSFPLDGATSGDIRILLGAGDLTLQGGAPAGRLMDATVYSRLPEMQPDFSENMNNSVRTVLMTETGHEKKDWVIAHSPESWANSWDVRIGGEVPVALTVNVGAGDCRLIPGPANLTSLTVNTGVGDTLVDLADYRGSRFTGVIHNGVGDLTIRISKESNTRILMHHGVGDISTQGIEQNDESYTPAGFNPALPASEISVSQGVGSIQLEAV